MCDDTSCTLREAIEAAAAGGQVVIASGLQGTVTLTVGTLLVQRGISVDGGGRITVDAQGSSRVMTVTVGSSVPPVSISGFTFKNAHSSTVGGALAVSGAASLTVQNTVISGSKAEEDGGGVWIDSDASLTLINSTVSGNTAVQGGGGIYSRGKLTLRKSTVSSNVAAEAGGIYGIGGTQTTVEQSTISGNDARALLSGAHGGGIVSAGSLALRSATITKNSQGGVVGRVRQSLSKTLLSAATDTPATPPPASSPPAAITSSRPVAVPAVRSTVQATLPLLQLNCSRRSSIRS